MSLQAKPVWSSGYKPDAKDLKGLYQHTHETSGGLVIECYLDFQKAEPQTYDEPGCAASVDLIWALVQDVDIAEVLGSDMVAEIEEAALLAVEEDAEDCRADIAADRYEDERCEA